MSNSVVSTDATVSQDSSGLPQRSIERAAASLAKLRRQNLRMSIRDSIWFGLMVGLGETYFAAFGMSLGMHDIAIGLIATLPMLIGSCLQLVSPIGVARTGSFRRWVVLAASFQCASLWLMAGLGFFGPTLPDWADTVWLFGAATFYWAGGMATSPAWNAWIEMLVPRPIRASFFARRTRDSQAATLSGIIFGGVLLRLVVGEAMEPLMFALIFAIAGTCRLFSVFALARQSETGGKKSSEILPKPLTSPQVKRWAQRVNGLVFIKGILADWSPSTRKLVAYLLAVQAAVYVSAPYFTPYMLRELQLSYLEYMWLISVTFVGKALALPWAGRLINKIGAVQLMWIGGLGIVPVSLLWLFSSNVWYLTLAQLYGGCIWACYELAMLILFFQQVPAEKRISVLSLFNLGNAMAMTVGSLLGGAFLARWGTSTEAYLALFVASGIARLVALVIFPRHLVANTETIHVESRSIAVRPTSGAILRPVVPSISEELPAEPVA